jgi:DDE superfamily endonuclease
MLLWDGLPAHRSNAMRAWLATQRSWLVVERLPAYAPELNPIEGLWSSLKAVELANLASPTLAEVITRPIWASSGCVRRRISPIRSCAMPVCRSHDPLTRHPSPFRCQTAPSRRSPSTPAVDRDLPAWRSRTSGSHRVIMPGCVDTR